MPGEHSETVFTETYYQHLQPLASNALLSRDEWDRVVKVRMEVSRALEKLRVDGQIGGALDAEVNLYCDTDTESLLNRLDDELRFILITSEATVGSLSNKPDSAVKAEIETGELWIGSKASEHDKCERCWHHRSDVGSSDTHPTLCTRCIQNIDGDGEPRRFT